MESATGIYTGAVYCDMAYVAVGMIGEFIDTKNVLVVKTHAPLFRHLKVNQLNYDKAIYIVRSPFGAILANHMRVTAAKSKELQHDRHTAEVSYNFGMYLYCYTFIIIICDWICKTALIGTTA